MKRGLEGERVRVSMKAKGNTADFCLRTSLLSLFSFSYSMCFELKKKYPC